MRHSCNAQCCLAYFLYRLTVANVETRHTIDSDTADENETNRHHSWSAAPRYRERGAHGLCLAR